MTAAVRVDASYVPCVSWAARFEGQQVIRQIRLQNLTDEPLPEIVVRASIDGLCETPTEHPPVGLAPRANLVLEALALELSEGELAAVQETRTGTLRIEVHGPEGPLAEVALPLEILAWDSWAGVAVLPELLAAFCRPHLARVVAMAEPTDYARADPFRIADRLRMLHYRIASEHTLEPTAPGARIRAPGVVVEEGTATALDLALWMAAALEASGLHPLVAVTDHSALVGVWRVDHSLPFPVLDDPAPILRRLDNEELAFLDATPGMAYGPAKGAAREALEAGAVVIDIRAAREAGIRPLPRTIEDGAPPAPIEHEPRSKRLERWKAKLLDLSMRNRLLNCKDSRSTLPLLVRNLGRLEDLLHSGERFTFEPRERRRVDSGVLAEPVDCQWCGSLVTGGSSCPSCGGPISANQGKKSSLSALGVERLNDKVVAVDLTPNELDKRLRNLYRSARVQLEETGANTLYVALGMLSYYEHDGAEKPRTAPLLLLPVQLTRKSVRTGYALARTDEDLVVNPTLLQYLHQVHAFDSLRLAELPLDEHGVDVPLVLQRFRALVQPKARWAVVETAWITQLSFTRYMMWLDLETRTSELVQNLAVRQLLTDDDTPWPALASLPSADTLEEETDAADVLCPMDADSSQLAAVFAAEAGHSFVLQGPPGTGKSQTITNLIAHALAHGRTVLFVSEKMAALDVVHRRLESVGLAPFCLELHSNKSRKSDVIRQLQAAFDAARKRKRHDWKAHAAELQALRDELSGYVRALHEPGPLGRSAYQAAELLVRYADREDLPRVPIDLGPPDAVDPGTLRSLLEDADALCDLAEDVDPATSPWRWVGWTQWTPEKLPALRTALAELDAAGVALQAETAFSSAVDRQVLDALGELARLLPECPGPTTAMVTGGAWAQQCSRIATWIERGRHRQRTWAQLAGRWSPELLERSLGALQTRFADWAEGFFLFAFFMLFFPRRRLGALAVSGLPDTPTVRDDLKTAMEVQADDAWLEGIGDEARELVGPYWAGRESDFDALEDVVSWSTRFRSQVAVVDEALRTQLLREVTETPERFATRADLPRFAEAVERFVAARKAVADLLDLDPDCWSQTADHVGLVRERVAGWQAQPDALRDWVAHHGAATRLRAKGLGAVLDAGVEPEDLRDVVTMSVWTWWLDAWTGAREPLRAFHGLDHDRRITRFRELDIESRTLAQREVRARLAAKVPKMGIATHGEMGVLNRELRKKRNHLAVRKLFESIPNVLQRIKPCVLMSPLSVAQYLDPGLDLFDLVVFDEASQIPPWEAIGAMARARQVVVVGDTKQLPPTSFFSRGEEDVMDEEARKDLESILDECVAIGMPALTLDWHYRSQHEALIAFSNTHYYDDRLFTFPCARANAPDLGVSMVRVDGVYDKGATRSNAIEAEALVQHVVEALSDPRHSRSIGIVTFSMAQQGLIEDLLDEARREDPELEPWFDDAAEEPVFVKNLENVQGDERDVIYFSIGYGPDAKGKMSMNFGPLNRRGGERRLNVAITRARMQLVVFSSIDSTAIDLARTSAVGVQHLKSFLFHAEQAAGPDIEKGSPAGPLAVAIQERLHEEGYAVDAMLGSSDFKIELAVQDPADSEQYLLGIETDGPLYAASPAARDRDRLRGEVLSRLGWSLHRVWTTEWLRNPERSWKQLASALEDARRPAPPKPEAPAPIAPLEPEGHDEPAPAGPPAQPEYVIATDLPGPTVPEQSFYAKRATEAVTSAIRKVLDVEAPLHEDELARRVAACWGLTRLTAKPRRRVSELLATLDPVPQLREGFVWRADQAPDAWTTVRVPGHERSVDQVPPEERAAAIAAVLEGAIASTREDLARDAARMFGVTRLGTNVQAAMYEGIAVLEARGVCAVDGENVTLIR